MTDIPFTLPDEDPTRPARPPRKCRRHDWEWTEWAADQSRVLEMVEWCKRCHKLKDDTAARRGRTNRSRGNAIEREIGHRLGLRRVGQYGGPDDLSGDLFAAQVKSGGAFSERYWNWLQAVPHTAGQTPILVVTDAPGPGHTRRAVVVIEIGEWIALHGGATNE